MLRELPTQYDKAVNFPLTEARGTLSSNVKERISSFSLEGALLVCFHVVRRSPWRPELCYRVTD
jgi:hypothetical protein